MIILDDRAPKAAKTNAPEPALGAASQYLPYYR